MMDKSQSGNTANEFDPQKLREELGPTVRAGAQSIDEVVRERVPDHGLPADNDGVPTDTRYRIGEFIAKGGMGAIFDAEDRSIQRSVAM